MTPRESVAVKLARHVEAVRQINHGARPAPLHAQPRPEKRQR